MQMVSIETICVKCQILFSGKNKKNISLCPMLKIVPKVLTTRLESFSAILFTVISKAVLGPFAPAVHQV